MESVHVHYDTTPFCNSNRKNNDHHHSLNAIIGIFNDAKNIRKLSDRKNKTRTLQDDKTLLNTVIHNIIINISIIPLPDIQTRCHTVRDGEDGKVHDTKYNILILT